MQIITKEFNGLKVRIIVIDGIEWFVAKDVTEILGYIRKDNRIDTNAMIRKLDQDDVLEIDDEFESSSNMSRRLLVINESGLYNSIFGSKLPSSKDFKLWVTREVLPSIRKTGSYSIPKETSEKSHQTETLDLDFYTQQSEKIFKLVQLINSQNIKTLYFADNLYKSLNIQSPLELLKIDLSNYYFIPTELGKLINSSAIETNKILEARGLQTKQNGIWILTEKGRNFAIEVQNGSFLQIKWNLKAISE